MKQTWLIVLLILAVQFVLRLPFLTEPLNLDESTYTQIAARLSQGERLYRDIVDVKPPLLFDFYQAVGQDDQRLRLVMTALSLLTTLLVLQAGWLLGGRRVGLAAALLYAVFSGGVFIEGTLGSAESLMLPLLMAGFNGVLLGGWWVLAAGVCSGAAVMIKQTAALNLLCLLGFILWRRRYRESLLLVAGALLVPLLYVVQLWLNGDLSYAANALFVLSAGMVKISILTTLIKIAYLFLFEDSVLWLLALIGIWFIVRQNRTPGLILFLWWSGISLAGIFSTGYALGHYFIQLVPALALLGGLTLGRWREVVGARRKWFYLLLIGCAIFTLISQYEFYLVYNGDQIATERYSNPALPRFKRIGQLIRARTKPGDQVYGFSVAVYYSGRRQPVKYYITVKGGRSEIRLLGKLLYAHDFGIDRGPEMTRLIDEDIYQAIADRRTKYLVFGLMNIYVPPRLKEVITANGYVYDRELSDPDALIVVYKR